MKHPFVVAGVVVSAIGCSAPYHGDGSLTQIERPYIPIIAVTKGFIIELPEFRVDRDHTIIFNLDGLPRLNDAFTIELATYLPTRRMTRDELEKLDLSVPPVHEIHCVLFAARSQKSIADTTVPVASLPQTSCIELRNAPFVKQVVKINNAQIPKNVVPKLRIEYRIHGVPLNRGMKVLVVNDAPLA